MAARIATRAKATTTTSDADPHAATRIEIDTVETAAADELRSLVDEEPKRRAELDEIEDEIADTADELEPLRDALDRGEFHPESEARIGELEARAATLGKRASVVRAKLDAYRTGRHFPRVLALFEILEHQHKRRCDLDEDDRRAALHAERDALLGALFSAEAVEAARTLVDFEDGPVPPSLLDGIENRPNDDIRIALPRFVQAYLSHAASLGHDTAKREQQTPRRPKSPHAELMARAGGYSLDKWKREQKEREIENRYQENRGHRARLYAA